MTEAVPSRAVTLDTPVQFVRGVGPIRAAEFARIGVCTVGDLIEYFPFRHERSPKSQPIGSLELGTVATVVGEVARLRTGGSYGRRPLRGEVVDGTGRARVRWFNSAYLADKLHAGQVVRITGKVDVFDDLACFTNPQTRVLAHGEDPFAEDRDRYLPVYPATANLPARLIAGIIASVLEDVLRKVTDFLPETLRQRRGLPPRRTAILRFHKPTKPDDIFVARKRLAYDEFLLCQLGVQLSRLRRASGPRAHSMATTKEMDRRIRCRFPFQLTAGQNRAIEEIRADLARRHPMNRLLQADVGAGKTIVAVYAALTVVANKRQVALLAPTEVLAAQHRAKFEQYLAGSRVRIAHLAGSTRRATRAAALSALRDRKLDVLIGTHALLEADVDFAELGLVVVDEQHKFGVAQRARLRRKGTAPHTLVLTATPIPRTLAMTVFGDLDVSTMTELPPGRRTTITRLLSADRIDEAWHFVRTRLQHGEQAYVVYPLVEESDGLPLKAARTQVAQLAQSHFQGHQVGLLHGRMNATEKNDVMRRFRAGDIHVLVSTTVIEVGVDVPNATVMVIEHAERFGLSQLHQLRGRIGRGARQSYCWLVADPKSETAEARLRILAQTNDGFRIAEEDLRLRGPGELLGTRQHGIPAFKVANLIDDFDLLAQARDDAATILREDPSLAKPHHIALRDAVAARYGHMLDSVNVA